MTLDQPRATRLFNRLGIKSRQVSRQHVFIDPEISPEVKSSEVPLATIALESTAFEIEIRETIAKAFTEIRQTLRPSFLAGGVNLQKTSRLAAPIVSAHEGGLIRARVASSKKPLQDTAEMLIKILKDSPAEVES